MASIKSKLSGVKSLVNAAKPWLRWIKNTANTAVKNVKDTYSTAKNYVNAVSNWIADPKSYAKVKTNADNINRTMQRSNDRISESFASLTKPSNAFDWYSNAVEKSVWVNMPAYEQQLRYWTYLDVPTSRADNTNAINIMDWFLNEWTATPKQLPYSKARYTSYERNPWVEEVLRDQWANTFKYLDDVKNTQMRWTTNLDYVETQDAMANRIKNNPKNANFNTAFDHYNNYPTANNKSNLERLREKYNYWNDLNQFQDFIKNARWYNL